MKTQFQLLALVTSICAGTISPLPAQVASDGATRTLSNVTNTITGTVTVGTNGSFTLLTLANDALLTNSGHGVISQNATATSNEVRLVRPSARWLMGGTLFVGSNGAFSTLVVSNGALVRANAGFIGRLATSGSNVALVTGAGSMWSNVAGVSGVGLTVGSGGSGNHLIVSNGGWVVNAGGSVTIGGNGSNNVARVTGPGSVWSNRFALNINPIGAGNANNRLVIEDGGQVFNDDGLINGLSGSSNNFAFITGSGAVWNNSRDLYLGSSVRAGLTVSNGGAVLSVNSYVGSGGSQMLVTGGGSRWSQQNDLVLAGRNNTLAVTHGGSVVNSNGYVGGLSGADVAASNNTVLVTGAGSTWSNRADLVAGYAGSGNLLVVSNGATVSAGTLFVGFHSASANNRVVVDGGTLRVTNLVGNATLDVRRGTNVLNAGLIEVDRLLVTNTAGRFEFNDGTLFVGRIITANGQSFRVGRANGLSAARLHLTGNNTHSFGINLAVSSNAVLTGNGTIGGSVDVAPGGAIAPGASIGVISLGGAPSTLQGVILMEISRNGSVLTNDQIRDSSDVLTYSGSLRVTHIGPTALTTGNRFQLFSAAMYAGSFASITLPTLDPGLRWRTNLAVDGSIEVIGPEAPTVLTRPASSIGLRSATLHGVAIPNGATTTAWFEWGTTTNYGNVTPPVNLPLTAGAMPVSAGITGQFQAQTIHFRLVATNALGRANGSNFSFNVPAYPGAAGLPPLRSSAYDGSQGSFVSFEARAEWDRSVAMTIEGWVYRQDTNRVESLVSHGGIVADSYMLGFSPRLRFQRGTNFAEVPRIVPARKWTHVAVSYDGAAARFYINGALVGTRVLSNTGTGKLGPLTLGDDGGIEIAGQPRNRLQGNLDEIRIWSLARSSGEISDGLYREVRGESGLMAVFPRGGQIEEISGLVGTVGIGVMEQVFGMMPRDLVVPRSPVLPVADGLINEGTEYLGADLLVTRYPDFPDVDDTVARFVRTDNDLFVALQVGGRLGNLPNGTVGLFVDTTNGRPALAEFPQIEILAQLDADTNHTTLLNGDGLGGYYLCLTPPGLGLPRPCTPRSLWQATQRVCGGEILPDACVEFRVSRTLLGSFNEFDGVALGLFNASGSGDQSFTPEDSLPNSPANWVTMTYGNGSATLPRVKWNGRVFASPTNMAPPLRNHPVSLFASDIAHTTRTSTDGGFTFDVPMPVGQFIRGQPGVVSFALQGRPEVGTHGVQPLSVFTNGVLYPALPPGTTGVVQLAQADFFLQPPPGTAAITGASPLNPQCGMAVALGGVGGFGQKVTLLGTNLHGSMNFYLAPVSATFPNDPLRWTLLPVGSVKLTNDGTSVVVEAPFVPEFVREFQPTGVFIPSFNPQTRWRWVAHDTLFRPGRIEYSVVGDFAIRPPPYPNIHGFNFVNRDSDATINEFLAGYGFEAYFCVDPVGDCDAHVLNPLYPLLWYPVYRLIINGSGGSCVGFSGTALELFNRLLPPQRFDPNALLANGISGDGFPGHYDTSNNGGRSTRPPIPTDIWGQIRQNHGAQTSAEYLLHALSQLDSDSIFLGDPVARLPELRAGTTAQALCMSDNFERGHCVTPYLVEDNFGGNPDKTRIWIYDNEAPCAIGSSASDSCVRSQFIDIDHVSNTYCCFGGSEGRLLFTVPGHLYTGKRTAPGLLDIAQLLGSFVFVIAGGADAHLTAPGGREWGWRADETFVNNLPGLRAVPIFGSSTNRTRGIPLVLPLTNDLPGITVHTRDTNAHIFHVAQGGTMLQLEAAAGQLGHSNRFTLGSHSNQLASFRFTPQAAHSNFISRVGMSIHSNASVTFQWAGLASQGGRAQEFRALRDRRAVEYCNEATHSNRYSLRIDAVDGATRNNACAVFGPFEVPPGAVHCVVLHEWPRARTVRSELDLDADGTPDRVDIVTGTEIDTDGDGIPDAWETRNQLNPEIVDCDDDADNDGISNLGEYLTDTDPRDPLSALRVNAMLRPGNQVRLSWHAVPGRRYEILYANGLEYVFQSLPGAGFPRVATSTEEHFDDVLPSGANRMRFYKVRLAP